MPAQDQQKTICDVLLKLKKIDKAVYDKVKLQSLNTGKSTEQIVKEQKLATPESIATAKAKIYNVPFVNLMTISVFPEALNAIPEEVARHYTCFPYSLNGANNTLSVAMVNPLDLGVIEFLEQKAKKRILAGFATQEDIERAISRYYTRGLSEGVSEALKEVDISVATGRKVVDAISIGKVIREAPIARIVATLFEFAVNSRSSDIHIEPEENRTRVRYRIDGILHEKLTLPRGIHDALISRIKILAGMKIDEKRAPQDGRFTFRSGQEEVDLRVSSLPSVYGEKIVARLLKRSGAVPDLQELGLRGRALKNFSEAIRLPHGIILVTGPTGSGKTTTLYSALSKINTPRVNIITLEDPVEYEIKGITQVQINPMAKLTFSSGLRSFLRQDPDIIMVGEIRDEETAGLAVQAALTGHLVFSTLHTNSAAGALPRLLDMEVEPYLLASSMLCVVGQRVVRRVCPICKQEYIPEHKVIVDIGNILGSLFTKDVTQVKLVKGKGCKDCNGTGYSGRVGIFEVFPVTEKVGRGILEKSPARVLQKIAVEEGMVTMTQDGYLKVLEGITSIEEVLRVSRD